MKRNPSQSGTKSLADELTELRGLDPAALKQRWRVLYRTEVPVHIGQSLSASSRGLPATGEGVGWP
jgi:hypothetical protein